MDEEGLQERSKYVIVGINQAVKDATLHPSVNLKIFYRMKNITKNLLLGLTFVSVFAACKKDDEDQTPAYTCDACTKTPEAKAANDNSSKGIYKGIMIGSSGTIKFNVGNDGSTINAVMVLDGKTVTLSSSVTWQGSQWYIAPFTGTLNSQPVSITFAVNPQGDSATVTSANIPGHPNATFVLVKETSNALIEGFEGDYSTSQNKKGTFNILLSRTLRRWGGIARENGASSTDDVDGTIDTNNKLIDENGTAVGTLSGDVISGTFVDRNNTTITISGKRTL